ncbi:fibronectin type III domain-containing protein [Streptomyces sp. NPDC058848]|uniref:fibronectin type III domain-containing protein n=1 Tax=Streptomyces sp. NPDC058848 TaxID=3346650 RepID=UPI0036BDB0FA
MAEQEEKTGGRGGGLSGTVDIPGIGPAKKTTVVAIGGLAAVFVLWRYWQARAAADEAVPGDSDGDGFADGGTLPSVIGAVEDDNSYGLPTDGAGGTTSPDSYGFTGTTNSQWAQYAATQLSGSEDWSYTMILSALGKYLNRQPLDTTDREIVQAAIAIAGYPPEGNFPIIPATGSPSVTLPAPTGLRVSNRSPTYVLLDWNAVSGADKYIVRRDGTTVETSGDTQTAVRSLSPKTTYVFTVTARGLDGKEGPAASVSATTLTEPSGDYEPTKPPTTKPKPAPKPPSNRHRTWRITKSGQTLSDLVAAYNRYHKTNHTWQEIWAYNLKHRSASTVKTLKARGPNKVYRGSSFWFPY